MNKAKVWTLGACLPWGLVLLTALVVSGTSSIAVAGDELLIRATVNGKQTSLFEKVVVISGKASISPKAAPGGDPIEPFAIFFKLKTDAGKVEENGYLRIGDSTGKPIGFIKKDDVRDWNTRFILEPNQPVPGRTFSVALDGGGRADLQVVASGKRRFALITDSDETSKEDPRFSVIVYSGSVQSEGAGGTLARERNTLTDLKLEIVFVIEPTDFMLADFDGVKVWDSVKGVMKQCVAEVKSNKALQGAVRFGLVEYQDTSSKASFDSKITQKLTDNTSEFVGALDSVRPIQIDGDWPEAVLAGLVSAVDGAGWSDNSSKHIVLIGSAACQTAGRGQQPSQFGGDWNQITQDRQDYGWNSTGLSLQQVIARAHPQGGSGEQKARNAKNFHTILSSKDFEQLLSGVPADKKRELMSNMDRVVKANDRELQRIFEGGQLPPQFLKLCFAGYLMNYQRELAKQQHRDLSRNDGVQGISLLMEPNVNSIKATSTQLTETLSQSFTTLAGVRNGTVGTDQLEKQANNAVSQTFFAIVGANANKYKDEPALTGTSATRDNKGREVAQKKVLVAKDELQRLKSTLDSIHKQFRSRVAKADRQDVTKILDDLKQLTAQTTSGQSKFAENVSLKDIITDLPLRTTALETTPRDIAVMPSDAFKQWLNKLETAAFRADDLLNGKAEWLELSSRAENDKFTFLQVTELP